MKNECGTILVVKEFRIWASIASDHSITVLGTDLSFHSFPISLCFSHLLFCTVCAIAPTCSLAYFLFLFLFSSLILTFLFPLSLFSHLHYFFLLLIPSLLISTAPTPPPGKRNCLSLGIYALPNQLQGINQRINPGAWI